MSLIGLCKEDGAMTWSVRGDLNGGFSICGRDGGGNFVCRFDDASMIVEVNSLFWASCMEGWWHT